jgi:hypothetical protein
VDIYTTANIDKNTELREKRKERSKTFLQSDGTLRHLCFGAPIHYWTDIGSGEHQEIAEFDDIDISLQYVESVSKPFNSYISLKNKFTVGFRDDKNPEKYIGIRNLKGDQFEWTLLKVSLEEKDVTTTNEIVINKDYNSLIKESEYSVKHSVNDFDIVTDLTEVQTRTAIKTVGAVSGFFIQEKINLTGITILNERVGSEYVLDSSGRFNFITSDGLLMWIDQPQMWTEGKTTNRYKFSRGISHRLYEDNGSILYEKIPTKEGIDWLSLTTSSVFIDGDIYYGSTGDGYVVNYNASWSTCRAQTSGDAYNTSATSSIYSQAAYKPSEYHIYRSFYFFDTSALVATPISATLNLRGMAGTSDDIYVHQATVSSITGVDDFDCFSGSHWGTSSDWYAAYNVITLNSTGISGINISGQTNICCLADIDEENLDPVSVGDSICGNYYAEDATYKPYLDITEGTPPAAPTNVAATDGTYTDKVVVTWTKSTGATGYKVYEGANLLATLGDVATYDDSAAPAPTITAGTTVASDGTSSLNIYLSLSGQSTNVGTTRTYTVKALNTYGDSAASTSNTGYRGVGTLRNGWYKSAADSNDTYSSMSLSGGELYLPEVTGTSVGTGAAVATTTFPVCNCTGLLKTNCYLTIDLKCSNSASKTSSQFEIGSSASVDTYEWFCDPFSLVTITSTYQTFNIPLTTWTTGGTELDVTNIIRIRWYAYFTEAQTISWKNAKIINYYDTAAPVPTITGGTTAASDGSNTDHVTASLSGASSNDGAGRYYYLYMTATGASATTSSADRGYRGADTLTYSWYRSASDSDASYTSLGVTTSTCYDTTAPTGTITAGTTVASDGLYSNKVSLSLSGTTTNVGAGRYYKCYLSATAATSVYSTADRGYRGVGALAYTWQRSASASDANYSALYTPNANLSAYWAFSEGSGTSVADSTGNGHTMSLVATPTWTTGIDNNAVIFNGTTQAGTVPYSAALEQNVFSVSAFVKTSLAGAWYRTIISSLSTTAGLPFWGLGWNSVSLLGATIRDASGVTNSANALGTGYGIDNQWHRLSMTVSTTQIKFWIDGTLQMTTARTTGVFANGHDLGIAWHSAAYVALTVDSIRMYSAEISSDEITGTSTFDDTTAPLDGSLRYYKCFLTAAGVTGVYSTANSGYIAPFVSQFMII